PALPPHDDGPYSFEGVVEVPDATARELFTRAKLWSFESFRSAKAVNQIDDPEAGVLAGKAIFRYQGIKAFLNPNFGAGDVDFRFKVATKDGRFKYTFEDFRYHDAFTVTRALEPPAALAMTKNTRSAVWAGLKLKVIDK